MDLDERVAPDSSVYREVARLYRIARSLRPAAADRWTGELYRTWADTMGGLSPRTGALRLSADRVLPYLTGAASAADGRQQAQALATVLHEATHGAMQIKAPDEPNAVLTEHSRGVIEGFAEALTAAGNALTYVPHPSLTHGYASLRTVPGATQQAHTHLTNHLKTTLH